MDSASDFESGGCGFDPHRGCLFYFKMQTDKYIVHSYEVYTAPESGAFDVGQREGRGRGGGGFGVGGGGLCRETVQSYVNVKLIDFVKKRQQIQVHSKRAV